MNDCIFCKIVKGDARSWKVFENESVYAFFDINPVNEYHTLVIPKNHYENIFDVPENELVEVIKVVKELAGLYNRQTRNQKRPDYQLFRTGSTTRCLSHAHPYCAQI